MSYSQVAFFGTARPRATGWRASVGASYWATQSEMRDETNAFAGEFIRLDKDIAASKEPRVDAAFRDAWLDFKKEVRSFLEQNQARPGILEGLDELTQMADYRFTPVFYDRIRYYRGRLEDWRNSLRARGGRVTAPSDYQREQDDKKKWGIGEYALAAAGILGAALLLSALASRS